MKPNKIMHIDLETNNNPYYGAVASPRHPDNYVVMVGWAIDEQPYSGTRHSKYFNSAEEADGWLKIPDDVWLLVAHNAGYELDWMLNQQRPEILKFLQRGGRVYCTAYGHYLLSNQQDTYPPLDEIAPLYGGTHKVDGIKALWKQGVLTKDIDRDLLTEYLEGPEGDIENTRKCFYGQFSKLVQRGMWKGAITRMEGLIFCAFAMDSGLYVNREMAFAQMKIQEHRLDALLSEFKKHRASFPEECIFKESSAFHMSAWIYGGPIKYKARLPYSYDGSPEKYVKADYVKLSNGSDLRIKLNEDGLIELQNCPDSEVYTSTIVDYDFNVASLVCYASGKNKGMPKVFREDTDEVLLKWWDQIHVAPGLISLDELPDGLGKEFLEDWTGKRKLADGSKVISTAGEPLEILSKRKEFTPEAQAVLKALNEFAKLDKDLGTYYLREQYDDDGNIIKQGGMLQYLNEKDVVHGNLNCTATVTGRLSSNKPNLQNLPRGGTSDVKKMFASRFGDDGYVVEADYSALEVVTLAAFSQDKALIEALMAGIDMHCLRLAAQLDEPYADVLLKCKDQSHPEHERYDAMRTAIKPKAFQYQYGATAHGIAFSTGCTVAEAQAFIDNEKALFPDVEAYYEKVIFPAVEKSTKRQREEVVDDDGNTTWRIFGTGTWQAEGGTTYEFRQWPKTIWHAGQKSTAMLYKPTQMRNYPIQGESGFFVQGVCGLVMRWMVRENFFPDAAGNPRVYIISTVHDAIYLDCHKDVLDVVCKELMRIMETLPQHFEEHHGYKLGVPFPAAVEFGVTMGHKIHWHEGVLDEAVTQETICKHLAELAATIETAKGIEE